MDEQHDDKLEDLISRFPTLGEGQRPSPYPHAVEAGHHGQDDLFELGAPGDAPRSGAEAVQLGRQWIDDDVFVGVGYCLRTIRSLYGVNALYPDAETAWEEAERRHEVAMTAVPDFTPVWWTNGRYGHVAIKLPKMRALTTDYVRPGYLGVAPLASLGPWCGGRFRGWTNDINGVDVWEPAAPEPPRWTLEDRERFLRRALARAQRNGKQHRIEGLDRWLKHVQDNRKKA